MFNIAPPSKKAVRWRVSSTSVNNKIELSENRTTQSQLHNRKKKIEKIVPPRYVCKDEMLVLKVNSEGEAIAMALLHEKNVRIVCY